jgi:ParB/RepB/Spo0J family partition protein
MLTEGESMPKERSEAPIEFIPWRFISHDLKHLQPRRLFPATLQNRLDTGEASLVEMLWAVQKQAEQGEIAAQLALHSIEELADTIHAVGLIHPITVYPAGTLPNLYTVAEGERRLAAWALLSRLRQLAGYDQIPAWVLEDPGDTEWVQRRRWVENGAREDLSAIARARAMAQLEAEIITQAAAEGTALTAEQAQEMIGRQMAGLTGRSISGRQVARYLALLRLPPDVQELAELGGLKEYKLRPIVALESADEQVAAVRALVEERLRAPMNGLPHETVGASGKKDVFKESEPKTSVAAHRLRARIRGLVNALDSWGDDVALYDTLRGDHDLLERLPTLIEQLQQLVAFLAEE